MNYLRYSTSKDLPAIKSLMQSVFGDSEQFIDTCFRLLYSDNVLLAEVNEKVVSMAFLLPASIQINHKKFPVTYLYACATLPEYRGKGLMKNIIDKAYHDACLKNEIGVFLMPANESLYEYYQMMGFANFFYQNEQKYTLSSSESIIAKHYQITPINAKSYAGLRKHFLKEEYAIHYPENHFQLLEDVSETDIFFLITENEKEKGIAFIERNGSLFTVKELLDDGVDIPSLIQLLFSQFSTHNITLIKPGNEKKSAMVRLNEPWLFLKDVKGYFNFALD